MNFVAVASVPAIVVLDAAAVVDEVSSPVDVEITSVTSTTRRYSSLLVFVNVTLVGTERGTSPAWVRAHRR